MVVVKLPELTVNGATAGSGTAALVKMGAPVQVGLAGPKRVKVTVPVGAGAGAAAPVTVAVSEMVSPTVAVGWALVTMLAIAWMTTDDSLVAPHGLVTVV